ncbi:MAG: SOS response-associated peptidase [Chloroflexota bacterium]|nr:MAG: SOS response-associated peptidase [Chloroflexota bacterium]
MLRRRRISSPPMCGRYTLTDPEAIRLRFTLTPMTETRIVPRFNIAPSQMIPMVVEKPVGRALVEARWGFQPAWMRETATRPPPINARAEGIAKSKLFRRALERGRCLIPADGFYEWAVVPGAKRKQPYFIRLKSGGLFGFAGLATGPSDDHPATCAIITTAPNAVTGAIHDRMPVILHRDDEDCWLDPDWHDVTEIERLLQPYQAEAMEAFPVSSAVSSHVNDGPDLVAPVEMPGRLAL